MSTTPISKSSMSFGTPTSMEDFNAAFRDMRLTETAPSSSRQPLHLKTSKTCKRLNEHKIRFSNNSSYHHPHHHQNHNRNVAVKDMIAPEQPPVSLNFAVEEAFATANAATKAAEYAVAIPPQEGFLEIARNTIVENTAKVAAQATEAAKAAKATKAAQSESEEVFNSFHKTWLNAALETAKMAVWARKAVGTFFNTLCVDDLVNRSFFNDAGNAVELTRAHAKDSGRPNIIKTDIGDTSGCW